MDKLLGMWDLTKKVYDVLDSINTANILLNEDKLMFSVNVYRDTTELGVPISLQYVLSDHFRINVYKNERLEMVVSDKFPYDLIKELENELNEYQFDFTMTVDSQANLPNGLPFKVVLDLGTEEDNIKKMIQIMQIINRKENT